MNPEMIQVRTEGGKVGIVTLNRPKQLNALNNQLMDELGAALKAFDADPAIGCMIVTGSEKAFAAGADIGAMASWSYMDVYKSDYITRNWEAIRRVRKPVIAAVAGFALGGGCELAMMCDIILASEAAKFGQPEINLGIVAGMGGTQRLTRAVGKSKSMDMHLTGRFMDAAEAERDAARDLEVTRRDGVRVCRWRGFRRRRCGGGTSPPAAPAAPARRHARRPPIRTRWAAVRRPIRQRPRPRRSSGAARVRRQGAVWGRAA